jgi:hypothetical protein
MIMSVTKTYFNIYPGEFTKMFGTYNLSTELFDRVQKNLTHQIGTKYDRKIEKIYCYRDMTLSIDKNGQEISYITHELNSQLKKNLMFEKVRVELINRAQFPNYDKYHEIMERFSKIHVVGPAQGVSVAFITDSYGDDKINYIKVSFSDENNQDIKTFVDHIFGLILKEISSLKHM